MKKLIKSYNIFTIIIGLVLLLTVVMPPVYGLGDMSEYMSVFENVGLYNTSQDTYCISSTYGIADGGNGPQSVFEAFLSTAISLNKLFFSHTFFNIHFLSSIYCIIFLFGMYFLQKNIQFGKTWINYTFSALLSVVFLDLGYLAYFNSFYSEALAFALIIAICALVLSFFKKFSYVKLALVGICLVPFSTLKISTALTALSFGVLMLWHFSREKGAKRIASVVIAAFVIASSVWSAFNTYIPAGDIKLFNHVYNDIAKTEGTDLSAFALKDIPEGDLTVEDMKAAVEDITYGDVARYYISNPSAFVKGLKSAANNSYFLVLDFANYREAGGYYGIRDMLCLKIWNKLKRTIIPSGLLVILLFILAYLVVAVKEYIVYRKNGNRQLSGIALFSTALPFGALCEMVGTVLTTGQILISKNMFVFGIYFDMMLVTAIIWGTATLVSRRDSIKEKYGVNQ